MGELEARLVHLGEHGGGRRRGGVVEGDAVVERAPLLFGRVEQSRHDEGRAGEMRHPMIGDRLVHLLGAHGPEAHMGAGDEADRPREAPAVAVKHRQRPQIDRVLAHARRERVGVAHERRAAMVVHDALGVAGRAAGIIERDRVPFVLRHGPAIVRIAIGDEILIIEIAEALAFDAAFEVAIVDQERLHLGLLQRLLEDGAELGVADQHFRVGMVEHEGDRRGIEAGVDGMQHGARHWHPVMRLEHGRACWRASPRRCRRSLARGRRARRRACGCARRTRRRRSASSRE